MNRNAPPRGTRGVNKFREYDRIYGIVNLVERTENIRISGFYFLILQYIFWFLALTRSGVWGEPVTRANHGNCLCPSLLSALFGAKCASFKSHWTQDISDQDLKIIATCQSSYNNWNYRSAVLRNVLTLLFHFTSGSFRVSVACSVRAFKHRFGWQTGDFLIP